MTGEAMIEQIARALAEADNIEICSDAQYRYSSYGIRAQAAAAVIADTLAERDAEIARLREEVGRLQAWKQWAVEVDRAALGSAKV